MKSIHNLEDSFSDKSLWLSINRPWLLPEIGKKPWSHMRRWFYLVYKEFYYTFKRGMFRVGVSINFPILCAHFLRVLLKKYIYLFKNSTLVKFIQISHCIWIIRWVGFPKYNNYKHLVFVNYVNFLELLEFPILSFGPDLSVFVMNPNPILGFL